MEKKEDKKNPKTTIPNDIYLKDRKELNLTGVVEVRSATPTHIAAQTELGPLNILGCDLRIILLDEDSKMVQIVGEISEIKYTQKKSLFQRIFK